MGNGAQTKQERSKVTHPTREDWLTAAIASLRPVFAGHGLSLPARIRATCGLPSTFSRSGTLAECWADTDSADQTHEVMVSPTLADPAQVLAQLVGSPGPCRTRCHVAHLERLHRGSRKPGTVPRG